MQGFGSGCRCKAAEGNSLTARAHQHFFVAPAARLACQDDRNSWFQPGAGPNGSNPRACSAGSGPHHRAAQTKWLVFLRTGVLVQFPKTKTTTCNSELLQLQASIQHRHQCRNSPRAAARPPNHGSCGLRPSVHFFAIKVHVLPHSLLV